MGTYTAKKIGAMGDKHEVYGVKYWGTVEEAQMEVSFNLPDKREIPAGAKIEFDERLIRETKGSDEKPSREYMQLKKVHISGSQGGGADEHPSDSPKATQAPQNPEVAVDLMTKEQGDEIIRLLKVIAMEETDKGTTEDEPMPDNFLSGEDD